MGLDSVELLLQIEEEFGITFSDDEAIKIETVGQFRDAVLGKVAPRTYTREYIFDRIRGVLIKDFGVSADQISPEARIVRDLGVD